jgi:hypothetical protein
VARRNPLELIAHLAVDTVLHPIATTGKSVAIGRMVVGQVGRTAVGVAAETVNALLARRPDDDSPNPYSSNGRSSEELSPDRGPVGSTPAARADLRRVPPVNEPAHPPMAPTPGSQRRSGTPAAGAPLAVPVDAPAKQQGDPSTPNPQAEARRAPSRKAAANRPPVAKKAVEPAPVAKKAVEPAPVAKKSVAKKAPAKPATTAADAGEPPVPTDEVSATPADIADVAGTAAKKSAKAAKKSAGISAAKKATAKRSAAKKSAAKKSAAKKSAATKAPTEEAAAGGAATDPTASRAQPVDQAAGQPTPGSSEDTLVFTSDSSDGPVATSPDGSVDASAASGDETDHLEQPLIDPATAKTVQSQLETGLSAANPDNG